MRWTATDAVKEALRLPPEVQIQIKYSSFDPINLARLARQFPGTGAEIAKEFRRLRDEEEDPVAREKLGLIADYCLEITRLGLAGPDEDDDADDADDTPVTHDWWISVNE